MNTGRSEAIVVAVSLIHGERKRGRGEERKRGRGEEGTIKWWLCGGDGVVIRGEISMGFVWIFD